MSDVQWVKTLTINPDRVEDTAATILSSQASWSALHRKLEHLSSLQNGWDGDEAEKIDKLIIQSAHRLLNLLSENNYPHPDRIAPTTESGVVFEWHHNNRYMEIEIDEPYSGEVMEAVNNQTADHYLLTWQDVSIEQPRLHNWPGFSDYAIHQNSTYVPCTCQIQ